VVDFGTAVTFDIVSARRNYIGGVDAPGLEAMTNFLYQRTALLPPLKELTRDWEIDTGAMLSGAVFGYRGLSGRFLRGSGRRNSRGNFTSSPRGGYARLIATQLPESRRTSPSHSGRTDYSQSQASFWLDE
jgi:type III pantothenate kinase